MCSLLFGAVPDGGCAVHVSLAGLTSWPRSAASWPAGGRPMTRSCPRAGASLTKKPPAVAHISQGSASALLRAQITRGAPYVEAERSESHCSTQSLAPSASIARKDAVTPELWWRRMRTP